MSAALAWRVLVAATTSKAAKKVKEMPHSRNAGEGVSEEYCLRALRSLLHSARCQGACEAPLPGQPRPSETSVHEAKMSALRQAHAQRGSSRARCFCAPGEVRPFAFCESTPRTGKAKEKRSEGSRAPLKRIAPAGLGESCPPCPIKGAEKNFSRQQQQKRATESHLEGGREARSRRATWQCDVAAA